MITSIQGPVLGLRGDGAVVGVGGLGLAVLTTPGTRARLRVGEPALLATSLVVREDSLTLYGFAEDDERDLFELLQTSTGVGPRLALAVLAVHSPEGVRRAVATEDLVALTLVPGIGKKGAQRLIVELKDKLLPLPGATSPAAPAGWRETISGALLGLGWTAGQVDDAVVRLAERHPDAGEAEVPALLREALALLGSAR